MAGWGRKFRDGGSAGFRKFVHGSPPRNREFADCGFGSTLSLGCGGRSYLGNLHCCTPCAVNQTDCLEQLWQYEETKDDGMNRRYTPGEQASFQEIDPFFPQELHWRKAEASMCGHRRFVEADGRTGLCSISGRTGENWYQLSGHSSPPECKRNMCSCCLAYGGRTDYRNRNAFGRYPLFRIPWMPKAIFFDIDGTLVTGSS